MKRVVVLMLLLSVVGFGQEKRKEIQNSSVTIDPDSSTTGVIIINEKNATCLSYSESILLSELKDGQLEITKRSWCSPSSMNTCYPGPCDNTIRRVWKEIYTARDGKIVLSKTIEGKIVPAQGERIEWPKE